MKIEIPKVLTAVDLAEYAPELKGKFLNIWVNAPLDVLSRYVELGALTRSGDENAAVDMLNWYAEIWSQGREDTRWTLDELKELDKENVAFLRWMISATWVKIEEHRTYKKKG